MADFKLSMTRRGLLGCMGAAGATAAFSGLSAPAIAATRELDIISNESTQSARDVFSKIVDDFQASSGVNVNLNYMDHEGHKTAIRNYLVTSAPDICFWYSGERMRAFVQRGLFDDISDLFDKEDYAAILGGTISSVSVGGKQYGLPLGGRLYGNFYLKNVFEEKRLKVPSTWDELLAYGDAAKAAGLVPITFGSKELWPTGGIFDALNLRINGLDYHMALMNGEVAYTDSALTSVFDHWQELIEKDFFLANSSSFTFQEAAALLGRQEAGFMNIGSYVENEIPEDQRADLDFFPFPKIADIPRYDDFTMDSIHVPAQGKHKDVGRDFLAYFYQADVFNPYCVVKNYVPPRNDLPPSEKRLIQVQSESLKSVAGTAQFFDRDTNPDMAQSALKGFQEFMAFPARRGKIQEQLEANRNRIFKS